MEYRQGVRFSVHQVPDWYSETSGPSSGGDQPNREGCSYIGHVGRKRSREESPGTPPGGEEGPVHHQARTGSLQQLQRTDGCMLRGVQLPGMEDAGIQHVPGQVAPRAELSVCQQNQPVDDSGDPSKPRSPILVASCPTIGKGELHEEDKSSDGSCGGGSEQGDGGDSPAA